MLAFYDLRKDAAIQGILPGQIGERLVFRTDLVGQWEDEPFEAFSLSFTQFAREQIDQTRSGKPFDETGLLIARVEQLTRNDDLTERQRRAQWDLVVGEAHKPSASGLRGGGAAIEQAARGVGVAGAQTMLDI